MLGDIRVEPKLNRIIHQDDESQIEPRLMRLLCYLISNANEVIERDQIFSVIWGDAMVVDGALTQAISEIRRLLNDNPRKPKFIETIRKGGYRFIGDFQLVEDNKLAQFSDPQSDKNNTLSPDNIRATATITTILVIAIFSYFYFYPPQNSQISNQYFPPIVTPVTNTLGDEWDVAISPDGKFVTWIQKVGDYNQVFIQSINGNKPIQLSEGALNHRYPTWSKDSLRLAYVKKGKIENHLISNVPLGGKEKMLWPLTGRVDGLSWHPDNKQIFISMAPEPNKVTQIHRVDLLNETIEPVIDTFDSDLGLFGGDRQPKVSPDGNYLAFIRRQGYYNHQLMLYSLSDNSLQFIFKNDENVAVAGFDWLNSNNDLVYSATYTENKSLWQININTSKRHWIAGGDLEIVYPSVAYSTGDIVYEVANNNTDIWRINLTAGVNDSDEEFIVSNFRDFESSISPDNTQVAFTSNRTGFSELWSKDIATGQQIQLTQFDGKVVGIHNISWSNDNKWIAFHGLENNIIRLFKLEISSHQISKLGDGKYNSIMANWASDDSSLYYTSNKNGQYQMWQLDLLSNSSKLVAKNNVYQGFVSKNNQKIYAMTLSHKGIIEIDIASGKQKILLPQQSHNDIRSWTVYEDSIYYVIREGSSPKLMKYDFNTKTSSFITDFPNTQEMSSISISNDKKWITYAREQRNDINIMHLKPNKSP